jgi:hypothetical protein
MSRLIRLRARASRSSLRAPLVWIRHLGIDISDVFLASYPRSGNTMLRFPLAEIIGGVPISFDHVQRMVPEIGVHGDAFPLLPGGGRLIKTHESYRRKYRRAIYIVRDVRDVVLSVFARESAMGILGGMNLDDYIEPFLNGKMSRWGAWQEHLEGWLNSPLACNGNLLVLRFEEIHEDIESATAQALEFLGVNSNPDAIHQACVNNSIERMRAKEKQSATLPQKGESGGLVRSGIAQGWRKTLSAKQVARIERHAGPMLHQLGYGIGLNHNFEGLRSQEAAR